MYKNIDIFIESISRCNQNINEVIKPLLLTEIYNSIEEQQTATYANNTETVFDDTTTY